ncbi:MAG: UDP-2,3-diacylglucosamine diphosphatase LpxI [Sedimentisphaerales bacterium]|nr:UDP-2,3-diacylglucosamine diphosphatase LpxI [Sedimentisphaerales bacterium]
MENENTIGLIAGSGRLPILVAQGAKRAGYKVICTSLDDNPESELIKQVDYHTIVPLARPDTWIRRLKENGVTDAIMVGKVDKEKLFTPRRILRYLPDWRAIRIYYWRLRKKDKIDQTLLQAIAEELESGGIILQDSTKFCTDHIAAEGAMTKTLPGADIQQDIDFGWDIVKRIAQAGIGQAITVKEKIVIAVEAVEGTEKMIDRTGQLCRKGGWTLLKASKPDHDFRFDVPCVGPNTINSINTNGGKCLVVEAGRTIIIDKPETVALADDLGISIIGI